MNLGLLLIPALGGYYLLSRWHVSRYWVARQSGYKLFFSAAIAGAALLAAARLIAVVLPQGGLSPLIGVWQVYAPFDYAGTVAISAALAVAPRCCSICSLTRTSRRCARQPRTAT